MRVLDESDDIAYAKLFFKKAGFITSEWYPCFLAVRRGGKLFEDEYFSGTISNNAKRIYDVVAENGSLPLELIKQLANFSQEEKSKFDSALTELQMRLYLTMCGRSQRVSAKGEAYGWSSTVFCTTEHFFGEEIFKKAAEISPEDAIEKITAQIYKLNPEAKQKKIAKFITG
jgi:hypothetical protein